MTPDKPRGLLFDWDNTLVDTWGVIHHALSETFQTMGQEPWTLEQTRRRVRASARDTFPDLFGAGAEEAMTVFFDHYQAAHLDRLRAHDGAADMLSRLADAGCLLGVVSNKLGALLREESDHLGWTPLFHRIVGAHDAARDKPAVDAVELALEGSGLARGPAVWFVGDTDIDMLCAANAGCRPVLLRAEAPNAGEFDGIEPAHHVASCAALADIVVST